MVHDRVEKVNFREHFVSRGEYRIYDETTRAKIILGDADPYLNKGVAQEFHELFPASALFLLPGARRFIQVDQPEKVGRLILSVPAPGFSQTSPVGHGGR